MTNLFILPSCLGDTILTTGGIDQYKDEPSVVVASPRSAALFGDLPNLERLIVMPKKPWKMHWYDLWKETRGQKWNHIVDLRGSALSFLLSAKKRYVWTHRADLVHKIYQVSRCFGSQEALPPTLWLSDERMDRLKPKRPTLAVAPVPGWLGKQWPLENFITLLKTFCKKYPEAQVAVFAAPHEKNLVEPLLNTLPKDQCVDTIGGPLLDSAAMIKSSRLCIANDSGLMHLSAAVRTPTIALFGPSNEKIYGPWSDQVPSPHRAIRGEPFTGNVRQVHTDTKCYMTSLTVSPVWEVLQERWEALEKPQKIAKRA
jgi:heptosyltransferase III